jgi:hypothetical protein
MAVGPNPLIAQVRPPTPAKVPAVGLVAPTPAHDDLIVFVGFLGNDVQVPGRAGAWTLLYTDLGLNEWLIVEPGGCVLVRRVQDRATPEIKRDLIWVSSQAFMARGHGPPAVDSQFLTGDFTRAGDFDAELGGGTFEAPTGAFCEARSIRCCHRRSQ